MCSRGHFHGAALYLRGAAQRQEGTSSKNWQFPSSQDVACGSLKFQSWFARTGAQRDIGTASSSEDFGIVAEFPFAENHLLRIQLIDV